jgi:hypothetical protein
VCVTGTATNVVLPGELPDITVVMMMMMMM